MWLKADTQKLKEAKAKSGMSYGQMEGRTRIGKSTWIRLFNGQHPCATHTTFETAAKLFKVDVRELIDKESRSRYDAARREGEFDDED